MYRIAILTKSEAQGEFLMEQISRFCVEHGLFPDLERYRDQEWFFEAARKTPLTNAVIALPGVDGLNAVEHLRALSPKTRIIWCSLQRNADAGRRGNDTCRVVIRRAARESAAPEAGGGEPLHGQERRQHPPRWL